MKSMVCLFVFALVAAAQAHPGGLTGIPLGGVAISSGLGGGLGYGGISVAPHVQPIAPIVARPAQLTNTVLAPVKTIVPSPVVLPVALGGHY